VEIKIHVDTMGKEAPTDFSVSGSMKVAELKLKYEEKENVPVAEQKLFFNDVEMMDPQSLDECGLKEDAHIVLVLHYDVIVMGTGLKECILSGLMSVERKKVLHIDRNDFYGAESASMDLDRIYQKFKAQEKAPAAMGRSRDYNIDLVPKFVMGSGILVSLLLYTNTDKYLDFKVCDGSYVYRTGKIYKVPTTAAEVMGSSLMGFFEKRKCKQFVDWVDAYDPANQKTWQTMDINVIPMKEVYKYFGLGPDIQDFIGHSFALFTDDTYLERPAKEVIERVRLYVSSLAKYTKSPYLYPNYGLGDIPQGFARLSSIYGGTYMLRQPVDAVTYGPEGKANGVKNGPLRATCKMLIGDPSYFPTKVRKTGQVVRMICLLSHPIKDTNNAESCQIIIPQRQANRNSDIYIFCVSSTHEVCPAGKWVAILSTRVETADPVAELAPGLKLLEAVDEQFVHVVDMLEPTNDPDTDGCFITSTYDETSHFATTAQDVLRIYKLINGCDIEFSTPPPTPGTPEFDAYSGPKGKCKNL